MNANFEQELLNEFLEETQENINMFEEVLLQIESDLDSMDDNQINQLFRSMHTIKGSAGFFPWLEKLEKIAHKMEHVLDMIRKGKMQINSEITNVLFTSLDLMKEMVIAVVEGKKLDGFETIVTEQEIEALLESELEGKTVSVGALAKPKENICLELERKLTEYDRLRMKEAIDKKRHIYEVPLLFDEDCWNENI